MSGVLPMASAILTSPRVQRTDDVATVVDSAQAFIAQATRDQLVAEVEAAEGDGAMLRRLDAYRKVILPMLDEAIVALLGEGEVEVAPSGRVAYRGKVSGGTRTINEAAIIEHADELPDEVKPKQVWKLPTVSAIDKAVKAKRLSPALAAKVITQPPRVAGLKWRTLGDDWNGGDE